jgi:hypothetical protein
MVHGKDIDNSFCFTDHKKKAELTNPVPPSLLAVTFEFFDIFSEIGLFLELRIDIGTKF